MMNVIDRYLLAVRLFLPGAAARDIITELFDDIRSRVEDREGALGRPLTAAEQQALVNELGHPALLAGRYGTRRHLIGAEMFPFYWFVLKLALVVGVTLQVAIMIAMIAGGRDAQALRQATTVLPMVAFVQFGIITLVFAVLDSYGVLSRVGSAWTWQALPEKTRQVSPVWQLAMTAIFAAWWLTALRIPTLVFGPGVAYVTFAPVWRSFWVPILVLSLADIALQLVAWLRPQTVRFRTLAKIGIGACDLAILVLLARAGEYIAVTDAAGDGLRHIIHFVNLAFPWAFAFGGIGLVTQAAVQGVRLFAVNTSSAE
jgi:hypothetical protein